MTLTGQDVVLKTTRPVELLEMAVRILSRTWPNLVVEDGLGTPYLREFHKIPFGKQPEFFVYKNDKARSRAHDDPTAIDMIHLLRTSTDVTVVHDVGSQVAAALIAELKTARFPGELPA